MPSDLFQNLASTFQPVRRFIVPIYQRPYVWGAEDQWIPLWSDIKRLAIGIQSGEDVNAHFLGAAVLVQRKMRTGEVERREVIDGQQRMTTLQVFLKAFHDTCAIGGFSKLVAASALLIFNDGPCVGEEDKNKLTPTLNDQDAFDAIMVENSATAFKGEHRLFDAYAYFAEELREWIGADEAKAKAMYLALSTKLTLVVIDLPTDDEAQLVFETLNARGTPLLQSDLIKNLLLQYAKTTKQDDAALHKKYWADFEKEGDFWRKDHGRGHARRPRIEHYIFNYLILATRNEVPTSGLYNTFKKYAKDHGADKNPALELESIARHAKHYRRLVEKTGLLPAEENLLDTLDALSTTAFHPFLLGVQEFCEDAPAVREAIAHALDSWLIRRMVCRLTVKEYNLFCVELVKLLPRAERPKVDLAQALRELLLKQDAETRRWPDNEELKQAWLEKPLYKELPQPRLRALLARLEEHLNGQTKGKSEAFNRDQKLSIEHMMPQSWKEKWPLPAGDTAELTQRRNNLVQTMGNLTLLKQALNSSLSNADWNTRRKEVRKYSGLLLTMEYADLPEWDEAAIKKRGLALLAAAKHIWKRPAAEV